RLAQATKDPSGDQRAARGASVGLAGLDAEITFVLSGCQEQIRAHSERALLHLQRTLAVDEGMRVKWKTKTRWRARSLVRFISCRMKFLRSRSMPWARVPIWCSMNRLTTHCSHEVSRDWF